MPRDTFYAEPSDLIEAFRFDAPVVKVFDDMIGRSVPGYAFTLSLIRVIAEHYFQVNTRCYDFGCSTGAASLACANTILSRQGELVAIDNSSAMLTACKKNMDQLNPNLKIDYRLEDIENTLIDNASLAILNFTLQFVDLKARPALLAKLYQGLHSGGALIISEKVIIENAVNNQLLRELHHQFKAENGYSDLEISQKRAALEGVLVSQSLPEHQAALQLAGFEQVVVVSQAFNFMTLLAIKA